MMRRSMILSLSVMFLLSLASQALGAVTVKTREGKEIRLYKNSYALVIGNGNYTGGWDPLPGAVRDAKEVAAYLQTTEVTQGQWKAVMGSNPSSFSNCGDNCPVEKVSWNDCQEFIRKLNQKEGTNKYRLPTEAAYSWGNQGDCGKANYGSSWVSSECKSENPGQTMKVVSFSPNVFGLYDMHGNVYEWCSD